MRPDDVDPSSVQAWIAAARSGNREAADRLCRHVEPRLIGHVRRHMGPGALRWTEPDDVVQRVLVEVLRGLPNGPPLSEDDLWARLFRTAETRIRDSVRRHERTLGESVVLGLEPELGRETSGAVTRADTRRWLEELVRRLPPRYGEVVRLVGLEQRSFEETARALGLEVDTVRKRYGRARAALRERVRGQADV
jgi:RNA polymerase sigma-70 factor (ECF subfamily)